MIWLQNTGNQNHTQVKIRENRKEVTLWRMINYQ